MIAIAITMWQSILGGLIGVGLGDDSGGAVYAPALDFSDARNSQYLALLLEDI